jgi:hypothetical protein
MKNLIIILLLLSSSLFAQEKTSTLDFKLGVGRASLGNGDYGMFRLENELTKKFGKWLSSSISINVGIGCDNTVFLRQTNALSADWSLFISPFGNYRKNNFKVGTGLTGIYANITASQGRRTIYNRELDTYEQKEDFISETRRQTGFSIIIENELSIGKSYLLGLKVFAQPYTNGDILTGANIKFGIKL